ncbi:MAG TPA: hypothetical protein VFL86_01840 [Burkholderiaceae bacterium]|nr:hypothetical protein [Burkholderiaceae bacterium]
MTRARRAALALRREELLSITSLQRRRLALEASSLAALCDPMVQRARLWKGMKQLPSLSLLLPLLTLLAGRRKGPAKPSGLARRTAGLWRLCNRSRDE